MANRAKKIAIENPWVMDLKFQKPEPEVTYKDYCLFITFVVQERFRAARHWPSIADRINAEKMAFYQYPFEVFKKTFAKYIPYIDPSIMGTA